MVLSDVVVLSNKIVSLANEPGAGPLVDTYPWFAFHKNIHSNPLFLYSGLFLPGSSFLNSVSHFPISGLLSLILCCLVPQCDPNLTLLLWRLHCFACHSNEALISIWVPLNDSRNDKWFLGMLDVASASISVQCNIFGDVIIITTVAPRTKTPLPTSPPNSSNPLFNSKYPRCALVHL